MTRAILIVVVAALACAQGCARGHRHINVRTVVDKDGKVLARSPLAFEVKETHRGKCVNFNGLAGPTTRPSRGLSVGIRNSYTTLTIASGWLYVRGTSAYASGRRVSVGAIDAAFILKSDDEDDIVVYNCTDLVGETLEVTHLASGATRSLTAGKFVRANDGGFLGTAATPVPTSGDGVDGDVYDLIIDTEAAVSDAPGFVWCEP